LDPLLLHTVTVIPVSNRKHIPLAAQYFISTGLVVAVSVSCFMLIDVTGYQVIALLLLLTVSVIAMLFDILPVLAAAVASAVIWNFFFIPPVFTFHIGNTADSLIFLMYFVIALVNATLTYKIRKAEQKARDKEEKEQAIRLYNTLLNSLSHELRTPIATIVGAVDALKDQDNNLSPAQRHELLQQVDTAGIRLNRQVEDLLNMSRLESGMLKPHPDWCDLNELIFSALDKCTSGSSHTIRFDPDEQLPLFKLDRGIMDQVLQNILYNAIVHTPPGSVVSIEASATPEGCRIVVADNGNGFPEEELRHVFEKFYRLPGSKAGGSGLGLSIVKGFTEALRGTVSLGNRPGGGAQFTITIPADTSFLNNLKHE
jgi:two-component system sensor histidine kinase KdpD